MYASSDNTNGKLAVAAAVGAPRNVAIHAQLLWLLAAAAALYLFFCAFAYVILFSRPHEQRGAPNVPDSWRLNPASSHLLTIDALYGDSRWAHQ